MNDPTLGLHQDASLFVLIIALVMGFLILGLPRRHALIPIVLVMCFVPVAGKLVVGGLNFSMLRLIVCFGWARMLMRNELRPLKWSKLDTAVVVWAFYRVAAFTALWQTSAALTNGLGYAYDAIGLYLLFRMLISDTKDLRKVVKLFAVAFVPLAILMCIERFTGRNPFYVLGGVPAFAEVRNNIVRGQGPFGHPILAGTFGAVWLPLFIGLWLEGRGNRKMAAIGVVACTVITLMSGSSGPIGSYLAGIVGLAMWGMRRYMRLVRWGIVACILALHAVMKDPVWFIFARVDVFSGSTGWHRANLIDRAIANFGDWWLVGAKDVARWGVWAGDTTNQFIVEGVRGGIVNLLLFVWVVVTAFSCVGLALRAAKIEPKRSQLLVWAVGAAVFAHLVSFLGVSYFDQNIGNWYLVLAMVAAVLQCRKKKQRLPGSSGSGSDVTLRQLVDSRSLTERSSPTAVLS